jgi:cation diffusion facilitator family transporter
MHLESVHPWQHAHTFGTDEVHAGERRTRWVIALTFSMMVVEIVAGIAFGSMALLADGWHMATHAAALGVAAFAYAFARRRANDRQYSFGTGKVSALGGFGSAVSLAVVALLVLAESIGRLAAPVNIRFNEAIGVTAVQVQHRVLRLGFRLAEVPGLQHAVWKHEAQAIVVAQLARIAGRPTAREIGRRRDRLPANLPQLTHGYE